MGSLNVVSAGTLAGVTQAESSVRAELWFRRGLLAASAVAALAILISTGIALWADNEFAPAESVVAAHSMMLAHQGTLYYDLNQYPYTISAYMPTFFLLEAGLVKLGLPAFTAARLISLAALLGLILNAARVVRIYTGNSTYQWITAILVAASPLTIFWGVTGTVDLLAISLAVAGFHQFARHDVLGEATLGRAALFVGLALFTKQTIVAAPVAMILTLALRDWKKALRFGLMFAVPIGAAVLALNFALNGRFLENTILGNMNPLSVDKVLAQLQYFGGVSGGLAVIVVAAVLCRKQSPVRSNAPFLYLTTAALMFLATAPKLGSDTNYQLETTAVLAICCGIGLSQLDFLRLYFGGNKSWITLLILPLAVHVVVGMRVASNIFVARVVDEQSFRQEIDALRPHVAATGGLVLSTDYNAMVRLRQRIDVEPLVYGWLISAGHVDPEPVRRDLALGTISTVILHEDVFKGASSLGGEIGSLPAAQLEAIRRHYRLVAHVPGPFLDGVFVYRPTKEARSPQ